jgi:hypothetical protein
VQHRLAFPRHHVCNFLVFAHICVLITYSEQKYVALKVCISDYPSIERERAAYARLTGSSKSSLLRTSLAEFELPGVDGTHRCFVFEPLTIDLATTRAAIHFDEGIKTIAFHVFRALEFLHTKAQMVHCGVSFFPSNFVSSGDLIEPRSACGKLLSRRARSNCVSIYRDIRKYTPFGTQNL